MAAYWSKLLTRRLPEAGVNVNQRAQQKPIEDEENLVINE